MAMGTNAAIDTEATDNIVIAANVLEKAVVTMASGAEPATTDVPMSAGVAAADAIHMTTTATYN